MLIQKRKKIKLASLEKVEMLEIFKVIYKDYNLQTILNLIKLQQKFQEIE